MTDNDHSDPRAWTHVHMVPVARTDAFTVAEFRCPGTPALTEVEQAPFPEIVLPRLGSYLRSDSAGEVLLNRATLAFFEAGRSYTIRHFRPTPDLSTVISITDTASLHAALGVELPSGQAFARSAIRMPADILLLHRRMLRHVAIRADRLAVEEAAAAIILRSLALNLAETPDLTRPASMSPPMKEAFAYAEAVIRHINEHYTGRIALQDIAGAVGLSVFHLCRVFHAATGDTIHQHLLSLRLEAAARELFESTKSITEIAHDVGFSSHSHLTALFTRTFGFPPSKVRGSLSKSRPVAKFVR